MKTKQIMYTAAVLAALLTGRALGHCDTTGGPVISEAKAALEKGDITLILKWVKPADEKEIRDAFDMAVSVRAKGADAKDLADRYFLETLVRLHRAGEGASYTGIKDQPVEPIVAMADKALADGSPEEMIAKMTAHMAQTVREKFQRAAEAGKHKNDSVAAGREFVEAYVVFVHCVEGIHDAVMSGSGHAPAAPCADVAPAAKTHEH